MLSFYSEEPHSVSVGLMSAVSGALMSDLRDLRLFRWQRASPSAPLGAARETKPI